MRRLIEEAEDSARKILTDKSGDLEAVALALLEYETLSGDEVASLLRGEPIFRPDPDDDSTGGRARASVPSSGAAAKERKEDPPAGGRMGPEPQPEG